MPIQCEELYMCEDPMGAFSEAILNYHNHYQDIHTSDWCRFHWKVRHNYVYSKLKKLLTKKLYQVSISFWCHIFQYPSPPWIINTIKANDQKTKNRHYFQWETKLKNKNLVEHPSYIREMMFVKQFSVLLVLIKGKLFQVLNNTPL